MELLRGENDRDGVLLELGWSHRVVDGLEKLRNSGVVALEDTGHEHPGLLLHLAVERASRGADGDAETLVLELFEGGDQALSREAEHGLAPISAELAVHLDEGGAELDVRVAELGGGEADDRVVLLHDRHRALRGVDGRTLSHATGA